MLEIVLLLAAVVMFRRQLALVAVTGAAAPSAEALAPRKVSPQLANLAEYANRLFAEKKWLAAEKAYLGVLKLDHKNVTSYTHLGIIYSTQKNLADAVECFEIAARLKPSGSTYQNLGLAYYENRNYMKAIATFEKAVMMGPTAHRYASLAKAYRKVSDRSQVIAACEKAVELEPTKRTLQQLAEAYEDGGRTLEAASTYRRIHDLDPTDTAAARKMSQPVAESVS